MLEITKAIEELQIQKQVKTDARWKKLSRQMKYTAFRKKLWNVVRTSAAIIVVPLLLTTLYFYFSNYSFQKFTIEEMREVTSAYGLVSKIILEDGSEVWLNSGSTLSYPEHFTNKTRRVKLRGEAYFKVMADKRNRFDVETADGLIISARGTEFNVNSYLGESITEAVLVKGKVETSIKGNPDVVYLQENQKASFNNDKQEIEVSEANVYQATAWKDGKMIFRRTSMEEVIQKLSRHFNVDIKLEGKKLSEYEYNATFTTESLNDILELLKHSAPISYKVIEPVQIPDGSFSRRQVIIRVNQKENVLK